MNNCSFGVDLVFDLPINAGGRSATVLDYWRTGTAFKCGLYAYTGTGGSSTSWDEKWFYYPGTSITLNVNVNNNSAVQLICWDVPSGSGIANINWND